LPWAQYFKDGSHSKTYLNLLDALLSHTSSNTNLAMRDLYIRSELLKYDFTKRQRSILTFIFGLSYDFGKNTAVIPKMKDWEICGIQPAKAQSELKKLVNMDVITWNKETNEFGIADPRGWKAPINEGYNQSRARELFVLNLKHAGIDVDSIIKKSLEVGDIF
jgi:hypothetical protein